MGIAPIIVSYGPTLTDAFGVIRGNIHQRPGGDDRSTCSTLMIVMMMVMMLMLMMMVMMMMVIMIIMESMIMITMVMVIMIMTIKTSTMMMIILKELMITINAE